MFPRAHISGLTSFNTTLTLQQYFWRTRQLVCFKGYKCSCVSIKAA